MENLTREVVFSQLDSSDPFPIDFDDAWRWLEFSRKDNAKRSLLSCGFIENEDFLIFEEPTTTGIQANPLMRIKLSVECFKSWAMMANTNKGQEVRAWYKQIEKEWRVLTRFNALTTSRIIGIQRENDALRQELARLEAENKVYKLRSEFALPASKSVPRVSNEESEMMAALKSCGFPMAAIARFCRRAYQTVRRHAV